MIREYIYKKIEAVAERLDEKSQESLNSYAQNFSRKHSELIELIDIFSMSRTPNKISQLAKMIAAKQAEIDLVPDYQGRKLVEEFYTMTANLCYGAANLIN